ncbi:gluconokinase [Ferrimonas marina]|uniref:Gluconokinase n=1 Tax=Ferrimonas marina TaxID=299255 RepID=A0A1M5ZEY9_9GAMM|nr:gluconokinase [Ferrimonas marina]SHI22798.1 gluconokinase [Ferrimonas marina]
MAQPDAGTSLIIMGVSSTGKSVVGAQLATQLGAKFIDGDDLHPKANILKMASGQALNDDDRAPWLERIRDVVFSVEQKNEVAVVVCSALKRAYRDQIREGNGQVRFLHLHGDFELIAQRMQARKGHFMPLSLLENQYNTLELPGAEEADVTAIGVEVPLAQVVKRCVDAVR